MMMYMQPKPDAPFQAPVPARATAGGGKTGINYTMEKTGFQKIDEFRPLGK